MLKPTPATLIATVGTKPQLVTLALDLLLNRDEAVDRVVVIHTTLERPATRESIACLGSEFALTYPGVRLRPVCLCDDGGRPLQDVASEAAVREAFRVLYCEIRAAKQAGRRVHLSIAGGRKALAVYGVAAAQLLFDAGDAAWHVTAYKPPIERSTGSRHLFTGQRRRLP